MKDTTSRWEISAPKAKLVAPWQRRPEDDAREAPGDEAAVDEVPAWERRAIVILARPLGGEGAAVGYARKEAELVEVFAALSVAESRALHERLRLPREDDELVAMMGRLGAERRARLVAFVADARRREAVRAAIEAARLARGGG